MFRPGLIAQSSLLNDYYAIIIATMCQHRVAVPYTYTIHVTTWKGVKLCDYSHSNEPHDTTQQRWRH